MKTIKKSGIFFVLILLLTKLASAQNNYYFPKAAALDSKIPTPEQFLGYPIGSYYTRHNDVVSYFRRLAELSDRVHVQTIGRTYEQREQIIVTVTSPSNYGKLEQIREQHLNQIDPAKPVLDNSAPVIIDLGYGVHGNETSSTEVSLLVGYYLAASQDPETLKWLNDAVIFIDPSLNPDGRDRAANWHNAYHSFPAVGDPLDKEHQEAWPLGRTNHYFTDLNRDWLNLVQVESRNRIEFFHKWYPNVQIDFHEQGTNATYYFEPTPARHYSPIIPQFLYDEGIVLAKYNAQALDGIGSLYFTKEGYDNLSPIYGSTYPKFFGAIAATYEQASSRGILQESTNGDLKFSFTIRNHLTTSFSTIRAAVAEKTNLFKVQKDFFKYALDEGRKSATKAYVFGDSKDANLTQKFLGLLLQHRVKVYELNDNVTADNKTFEKGKAYVVPSEQPNYLIVHSLFEENILKDSIYYDNTGWSIIHAYGLKYAKLPAAPSKGEQVTEQHLTQGGVEGGKSNYAYLINYTDYNATRALYHLLQKNILVKTSFKTFVVGTANGKRSYGYGSLIIPVEGQSVGADSLYNTLQTVLAEAHIKALAVSTGYNVGGVDLGSNNAHAIKKPEVAVAFGQGVTSSEAGQVWFLFNQQLDLPVTKLDVSNFERASLQRYTTIVLPGGNYSALGKPVADRLREWVNNGGNLITFQAASAWVIQEGIVNEHLVTNNAAGRGARSGNAAPQQAAAAGRGGLRANAEGNGEQAGGRDKDSTNLRTAGGKATAADTAHRARRNSGDRLDFAQREDTEGAKRINGAIFQADIDITNPIAFGLTTRKLFINKNGPTIIAPSSNRYATVAQYVAHPFLNGYASKENIGQVANSAAIIATGSGRGTVILFADDPTYRGYWLGTNRIFLNAVFLGNLLGGGGDRQASEEQE